MDAPNANGTPERLAPASDPSTTGCGMWILLLSLSILFFASLVAYLVIRYLGTATRPETMPDLPAGLWTSTLLLLASSASLHWALTSAGRDAQGGIRAGMLVTLLLGLAFLANQAINWAQMHAAGLALTGFYSLSFYFFTALHAAHVLGGILPMASSTAAAWRGFYTRTSHNGLRLLSMYWHFLAVVWIVLFAVLLTTLR